MVVTEAEMDAKCLSKDRLLEILKASDASITKFGVEKNSVGEFLFIRVKWESVHEFRMRCGRCGNYHIGPYPGLSFFGMGFDEKERRFYENEWRFHGATSLVIDTGLSIPLEAVLQEIEKRKPIKLPQPQPA